MRVSSSKGAGENLQRGEGKLRLTDGLGCGSLQGCGCLEDGTLEDGCLETMNTVVRRRRRMVELAAKEDHPVITLTLREALFSQALTRTRSSLALDSQFFIYNQPTLTLIRERV